MGEVLTIEEINLKYDSEWVLIADPQMNEAYELFKHTSYRNSYSC